MSTEQNPEPTAEELRARMQKLNQRVLALELLLRDLRSALYHLDALYAYSNREQKESLRDLVSQYTAEYALQNKIRMSVQTKLNERVRSDFEAVRNFNATTARTQKEV